MELVMTVSQKLQKMFDNFFETVKEEIKNENKKFNVVLMKFMKRFESFSQNQKVSAFQSFDTSFLDRKLTNFKVKPTAVSRKKLKSVVGKGWVMWEPKVCLISQLAWKGSTTWKTSLTWTSPLQRKQVNQWPVIQNYLQFKIKI